MYNVNSEEIYSPHQIESLKLLPSRKSGYAKLESIVKYIEEGRLRSAFKKTAKNGKVFRYVIGSDLIEYIERYHPDYVNSKT